MFRALNEWLLNIKIFSIFDLQIVSNCMLKKFSFIIVSLNKYQNICLSLYTTNRLIINIRFLTIILFRKSCDSKGIPRNWNPFFLSEFQLY